MWNKYDKENPPENGEYLFCGYEELTGTKRAYVKIHWVENGKIGCNAYHNPVSYLDLSHELKVLLNNDTINTTIGN